MNSDRFDEPHDQDTGMTDGDEGWAEIPVNSDHTSGGDTLDLPERRWTVEVCQNCGRLRGQEACPEDRGGVHIYMGAVEVVPAPTRGAVDPERFERDVAGLAIASGLTEDDAWRLARAVVQNAGADHPRGAVEPDRGYAARVTDAINEGAVAGGEDAGIVYLGDVLKALKKAGPAPTRGAVEVERLREEIAYAVPAEELRKAEAEIERLRAALRELEWLLSSPGDMNREEIRHAGVVIVRAALDEEEADRG